MTKPAPICVVCLDFNAVDVCCGQPLCVACLQVHDLRADLVKLHALAAYRDDPQPDPGPAAAPTDAEARAHMRRAPGHELTVGSDDQWHCLTCEGEEER